jgi:hypothetical protein
VSAHGQKLLNLAVLLTAGLWMITNILTVDADIWRGWTLQEVLLRLPYDNWGMYIYVYNNIYYILLITAYCLMNLHC